MTAASVARAKRVAEHEAAKAEARARKADPVHDDAVRRLIEAFDAEVVVGAAPPLVAPASAASGPTDDAEVVWVPGGQLEML